MTLSLLKPPMQAFLLSSITPSTSYSRPFVFFVACVWNILTPDISVAHFFLSFMSLLKYHLLSKAFSDQQI